jgi:hypothetical protein
MRGSISLEILFEDLFSKEFFLSRGHSLLLFVGDTLRRFAMLLIG